MWRKASSGRSYPHCEPSPKSCGKLREVIREETTRSTMWKEPEAVFARVNMRVRGWIGYFHYANSSKVFKKMPWQLRQRMRRWLWEETRQDRSAIRRSLQRRTPPRPLRIGLLPHENHMAKQMKQTEERHSESRMREICPSGLMRGRAVRWEMICGY